MSGEEEKSPVDAWKRWGSGSEEEESPDEQREAWKAYRRAFRIVWPSLSEAKQATGTFADEFLDSYRDVLESSQIQKLEGIRDAARAIAEVPEEQGWKLVTAQLGQLTDISRQLLNSQRARDRKEDWRYWLLLGVTIVIAIVGWARGLLLDIIHRLLGGRVHWFWGW